MDTGALRIRGPTRRRQAQFYERLTHMDDDVKTSIDNKAAVDFIRNVPPTTKGGQEVETTGMSWSVKIAMS